jgi:hypothetical protein
MRLLVRLIPHLSKKKLETESRLVGCIVLISLCVANGPPSGRIEFLGDVAHQHALALPKSSPANYWPRSVTQKNPPQFLSPSPRYTVAPSSATSSTDIPFLWYPSSAYVESEGNSVGAPPAIGSSQGTITADPGLSSAQPSDANGWRAGTSSQESICSLANEPSRSQSSNVPTNLNDHVVSCASDLRASVVPVNTFADDLARFKLHESMSSLFSEGERLLGHTNSGLPILGVGESLEAFEVRKDVWAQGSLKSLQHHNDLLI